MTISRSRLRLTLVLLASLALAAFAAVGLTDRPAQATGTTVIVSPSGMNGWGFFDDNGHGGTGNLVFGPGTPPLGAGSVHLAVGATNQGYAVATAAYAGTHFNTITTLSYNTYRTSGDPAQAISLAFDVDYDVTDLNTSYQGRLTYEPYYTNTVNTGSWQSWDTLTGAGTGNWWASRAPGNAVCPISNPCTWPEVLANFPNAGVWTPGGLVLKAGSGWASFDGNADAVTIGVSGGNTTYDFEPECTTTCYVNTATGNDTFSGATPGSAKKTIQAAISSVSPGGTVSVAGGTYTEAGQIVISKDLTIVGAGAGTTIIKPSADTGSSGDARGWFLVNPGKTFNLSNATLDGTGHKVWQAIRDLGQGTISNCAFTNIKFNESGPDYAGTAIAAFGSPAMNVNVNNCTFSGIGRVGVLYFQTGITGSTFSGNTYTGKGAGNWLDYAVEVGAGANATITGNTISGDIGVASVDGSTSAGILVTTFFGGGTQATITGNTISGSTAGIAVGYDSGDTSVVTASLNNISAPTAGSSDSGLVAIGAVSLNVHDNTFTGGYDAIRLRFSVTGTIANNTVSGYAKNGITVGKAADDNTGTNVTVSGNTVTGGGAGQVNAQNGIQVGPNAVATIQDNSVSKHVYTLGAGSCAGPGTKADATYYGGCDTAAGILVYHGTATITGNVISANQVGVDVADAPSSAEIHYNQFLNNVIYGVNNGNTTIVINAEHNWWGACDGPGPVGPGSGDGVSANVDFDPWLHGTCDSDGDLLTDDQETLIYHTDPNVADTDKDGCADGEEILFPPQLGGQRNPLYFWDFYDVWTRSSPTSPWVRDKVVTVLDILGVAGRFGANDAGGTALINRNSDPLTPPTSATGYHPDFDRGLPNGPHPWDLAPPDGYINLPNDILGVVAQYGHSCLGPP